MSWISSTLSYLTSGWVGADTRSNDSNDGSNRKPTSSPNVWPEVPENERLHDPRSPLVTPMPNVDDLADSMARLDIQDSEAEEVVAAPAIDPFKIDFSNQDQSYLGDDMFDNLSDTDDFTDEDTLVLVPPLSDSENVNFEESKDSTDSQDSEIEQILTPLKRMQQECEDAVKARNKEQLASLPEFSKRKSKWVDPVTESDILASDEQYVPYSVYMAHCSLHRECDPDFDFNMREMTHEYMSMLHGSNSTNFLDIKDVKNLQSVAPPVNREGVADAHRSTKEFEVSMSRARNSFLDSQEAIFQEHAQFLAAERRIIEQRNAEEQRRADEARREAEEAAAAAVEEQRRRDMEEQRRREEAERAAAAERARVEREAQQRIEDQRRAEAKQQADRDAEAKQQADADAAERAQRENEARRVEEQKAGDAAQSARSVYPELSLKQARQLALSYIQVYEQAEQAAHHYEVTFTQSPEQQAQFAGFKKTLLNMPRLSASGSSAVKQVIKCRDKFIQLQGLQNPDVKKLSLAYLRVENARRILSWAIVNLAEFHKSKKLYTSGYLLNSICVFDPEFVAIFYGALYKKCPLLMPRLLDMSEFKSEEECKTYFGWEKETGQEGKDSNEYWTRDKYLERVGVYTTLLALWVSADNVQQGITNRVNIEVGWKLISRIVNFKPDNIGDRIVVLFLNTAAHVMSRNYGVMFTRLCEFLRDKYMPLIKNTKTQHTLDTFLKSYFEATSNGQPLPPPTGWALQEIMQGRPGADLSNVLTISDEEHRLRERHEQSHA